MTFHWSRGTQTSVRFWNFTASARLHRAVDEPAGEVHDRCG
jgi:hypothetical protein